MHDRPKTVVIHHAPPIWRDTHIWPGPQITGKASHHVTEVVQTPEPSSHTMNSLPATDTTCRPQA